VGQGSITVESHVSLDPAIRQLVIEAAHHVETGYRLEAERSYLRVLEGGCSIPVFALATVEGTRLTIQGGIVSLDGSERITHTVTGEVNQAVEFGQQLAHVVVDSGGDRVLRDIKSTTHK